MLKLPYCQVGAARSILLLCWELCFSFQFYIGLILRSHCFVLKLAKITSNILFWAFTETCLYYGSEILLSTFVGSSFFRDSKQGDTEPFPYVLLNCGMNFPCKSRTAPSLEDFKSILKAHLFVQAFYCNWAILLYLLYYVCPSSFSSTLFLL